MLLENIVVDALDPQRLGAFWQAALGSEALTDAPGIFETRLSVEDGPWLDLCFPQVAERPSTSPRLHLDLLGGEEQDAVVDRLIALGARHLDIGQGDVPWVVLADPDGNAFCVMEEREAYAGTGPIAALPLHSADPVRDAAFWSWLTGWVEVDAVAPRSLRHPSLRGPLLELVDQDHPKGPDKNRLHLDVRLEPGEDADEVELEIMDRGGRLKVTTWGDLPWRTYLDPSDNELCVLPVSSG